MVLLKKFLFWTNFRNEWDEVNHFYQLSSGKSAPCNSTLPDFYFFLSCLWAFSSSWAPYSYSWNPWILSNSLAAFTLKASIAYSDGFFKISILSCNCLIVWSISDAFAGGNTFKSWNLFMVSMLWLNESLFDSTLFLFYFLGFLVVSSSSLLFLLTITSHPLFAYFFQASCWVKLISPFGPFYSLDLANWASGLIFSQYLIMNSQRSIDCQLGFLLMNAYLSAWSFCFLSYFLCFLSSSCFFLYSLLFYLSSNYFFFLSSFYSFSFLHLSYSSFLFLL